MEALSKKTKTESTDILTLKSHTVALKSNEFDYNEELCLQSFLDFSADHFFSARNVTKMTVNEWPKSRKPSFEN